MIGLSPYNKMTMLEYLENPQVMQMKQYCHHGNITTYDHCRNVTKKACKIADKLKLSNEKIRNIIIGSILHDFYLYDYHHNRRRKEGIHAWSHPRTALRNAEEIFVLNNKQRNIIRSHMFPTCLFHPPTCIEAWIVTLADKYCAIEEYICFILKKEVPYA